MQGLASCPYQDTQQPEAESDFTLQTRNPKVKSNKALILNILPAFEKWGYLKDSIGLKAHAKKEGHTTNVFNKSI